MKFFFLFTWLVLLWGLRIWDHLPLWLQMVVLCNALLAFVLAARKLYRFGFGDPVKRR